MKSDILKSAIDKLSHHFAARNWKYLDIATEKTIEKSFAWPGSPEENIMICVHKGKDIRELFHRQDFFFFNFELENILFAQLFNIRKFAVACAFTAQIKQRRIVGQIIQTV